MNDSAAVKTIFYNPVIKISKLFSCIDSNDWDGLFQLLDRNLTYTRPGYDSFIGRDAVMDFYKNIRIIKTGKHKIEKIVSSDTGIVCMGSFSGVSRDDQPLFAEFSDYYEMTCDTCLFLNRKTFFYTPLV